MFAVAAVALVYTPIFGNSFWFLAPFIILLRSESADGSYFSSFSWLVCFGLICGLLFYVRFFYGVAALATWGTYLAYSSLISRNFKKLASFLVAFLLGFLVFGLAIFHTPKSIFDYILINKNLSFGNSVDMIYDVSNYWWVYIAVFSILLSGSIYLFVFRRSFLLVYIALFLLFLKLGFSRTDHYIVYFIYPMSVVSLVFLFDQRKLGKILFFLFVMMFNFMLSRSVFEGGPRMPYFTEKIEANKSLYKKSYFERMATTYQEFKLEDPFLKIIGDASIDFYPYNNEYAFANHLNYTWRPSFQSYMTLTPELGILNKEFIESQQGPRFILWSPMQWGDQKNFFEAFDDKYILNEDPLTALSILSNYKLRKMGTSRISPVALFERKVELEEFSAPKVAEAVMKFNQWISVPKEFKALKLRPNFKFTLFGRLKNFLFRGNVIKIDYKLSTGEVKTYRVNTLNSQVGVWASPYLVDFTSEGTPVLEIRFRKEDGYIYEEFEGQWVSHPLNVSAFEP
ncbi:MAG: hypothetical protein WCH11_02025 [Bdellovibrio sp.]